jgi:hypothetical protein
MNSWFEDKIWLVSGMILFIIVLKFGKERKLFVFDQRQIELKNCEKNVILINKNLIVINRNTETDSLLGAFF